MNFPQHLIEYIGTFCDIDTKRALGIKPGKVHHNIELKWPLIRSVPIKDTDKTLNIWYDEHINVVRYTIDRNWLPTGSYHVAYYDTHGNLQTDAIREWCL